MDCPKCGEEVDGNFCSSCGQAVTTTKINWSYLWQQLKASIDINHGFLGTLRVLLFSPRKRLTSYLDGNLNDLSNPIKVLFISGTIATFITASYWEVDPEAFPLLPYNPPDIEGYFIYSTKYFSFFSLDALPIFALFSYVLYKSAGYNFVEHIILNIYILSGQFLIVILFYPGWLLNVTIVDLSLTYGIVNFLYNIWVLTAVFRKQKYTWIKALIAVLIPLPIASIFNYFVYRIAPSRFWEFLDFVFD